MNQSGVEDYVILSNNGDVLRRKEGVSDDVAKYRGEELYNLAMKARHVVRDLDPKVTRILRNMMLFNSWFCVSERIAVF